MHNAVFQHGAAYLGKGEARFRVWAPSARGVALRLVGAHPNSVEMQAVERGYHEASLKGVYPGFRYFYQIAGGHFRPDPASRCQPEGVHGPSELIDPEFPWEDNHWSGLPLEQCVLYELHVGAFTPEGTFDAIIPRLAYLRDLGVNLLELMPVAQCPGDRNWGYDGVYPYAAQYSYGGAHGLKRLINECHKLGLGVALDVVYNHLGPEGNYLPEFGPYFTDRYHTPWGTALNFDGPESDEVRRFFIENALHWVRDFHFDALRLDAVHGIFDQSAYQFLEELGDAVHQEAAGLNRTVHVIAESDLDDPRLVRAKESGGFGLDGQWADGFHHALRVMLTGERGGYYEDYGELAQLAKAIEEGLVFTGQYSRHRRRRQGAPANDIPAHRFIVFSQNHDQVGNRMLGERLSALTSWDDLKLAACAVILSPHLPLLFMGEEYGETSPFQYFISHSDAGLIEAVRAGRKNEFAAFAWQGEAPDPQAEETFLRSKLNLGQRNEGQHRALFDFYKELLRLRREVPAFAFLSRDHVQVTTLESVNTLVIRRWRDAGEALIALCFSRESVTVRLPATAGRWAKIVDSQESGPPVELASNGEIEFTLMPRSAIVYRRCSLD